MSKSKKQKGFRGPAPQSFKCTCAAEFTSRFSLKEHRRICGGYPKIGTVVKWGNGNTYVQGGVYGKGGRLLNGD